jgi:DNA primase catalytic subunit
MELKEKRIRAILNLYYSRPDVQKALVEFAKDREIAPSYMMESFGKRPDSIQYPSDIMGFVNRGATSFHSSEELWNDPLQINSDMKIEEVNELRHGWDLLIDVDSDFLDCSKIATKLIIAALEKHGVRNYGLKYSGSRGFHIIVGWDAFPDEYMGEKASEMFPKWPRAISEYLMNYIRKDYNKKVGEILSEDEVSKRTGQKKEDLIEVYSNISNRPAKKGEIIKYRCKDCSMEIERKYEESSKGLRSKINCLNSSCSGKLEIINRLEYYYSEYDKDPENNKLKLSSDKYPEYFEPGSLSAEKIASLDLVLVAPRHLFRMPYSLHEKTGFASVVIDKDDIDDFSPKDANPLKVKIRNFIPKNKRDEAKKLLASSLEWKKGFEDGEEKKKPIRNYETIDVKGVTEDMFPKSIKNLLEGLEDGRKRGLFILITFLRSLNFPDDYIMNKVYEWNKKNKVPLKEGYVKSQLDWHLRQKKKILPPNYDNESYYMDLGLIDGKQQVKNPIVEVVRELKRKR